MGKKGRVEVEVKRSEDQWEVAITGNAVFVKEMNVEIGRSNRGDV